MDASDIESLERATVAAVGPPEVAEIDGWLAPFDDGTIGRAKSAVPMRHDLGPDALDAVVAAYRERDLPPAFRMADVPGLAGVRAGLGQLGFAAQHPTVIEIGSATELAAFSVSTVRFLDKPDAAWAACFGGDGFDAADGAHRVAALSRGPDAIFAAAGDDGVTDAVGVLTFGFGWAGVHGMRTAPTARGKGYAGAILGAFGRAALARGVERVVLDVVESNPARSLYRRAGFRPVWRYLYWR